MPRGPGKKENYNFDYSRFNGCEDEDVQIHRPAEAGPDPGEVFKQLPGELQEAFRLMHLGRETGDEKAQARANELALKAVERGGPEMKQRFQQEVMRQSAKDPQTRKALEEILNSSAPEAQSPSATAAQAEERVEELSSTISQLQKNLQQGAASTAKHAEALKQQQDMLENIQSPEDFATFLESVGIGEEDLQRVMSGDEDFMRQAFDKAISKLEPPELKTTMKHADTMINAVDNLSTLCSSDEPDRVVIPKLPPAEATRQAAPAVAEPKIPEHRVQYEKDERGCLQAVQLRCQLPGVLAMSDIDLQLSEKYLRLRTHSPAYVVNAGPFPDLVDDKAARAKFSKKRQELTLTVPAKS